MNRTPIEVRLPILPAVPNGTKLAAEVKLGPDVITVEAADYTWNHTLYCLGNLPPDQITAIIAHRGIGRELPPELEKAATGPEKFRVFPDEGQEHVYFTVNNSPVSLSLYGLIVVSLVS